MTLNSLLYYRSLLDPYDQSIYDDLFQHWMCLDDFFSIKKPHVNLSVLVQAVHWDNPLLFYIDYYELSYSITPQFINIKGKYLYLRDEIKKYLGECEKWGQRIIEKLPPVGIAEKALWLHDVIITNVRYADTGSFRPHNLIGVILDKTAVCEGISKAYKFLCDLADIPCIYVSGLLENEPHGWNMLWIGGGTSFVDVTNDIRNGGGYSRNHFLRRASEMKGYSWDDSLIPDCKVYNSSNAFFIAHDTQEFLNLIRQKSCRDSLSISLQFGQRLDSRAVNELVNTCALLYPSLAKREIGYSIEQQMVYISKR